MDPKAARPAARGGANRAGNTKERRDAFNSVNSEIIHRRQARSETIGQQNASGPARLVVGSRFIVLVAEHVAGREWVCVDYFPLISETDSDLLLVIGEMQRKGYWHGPHDIKPGSLAPAMFSRDGADDAEARAAMARLASRGLQTSDGIIGICDPQFDWWVDVPPLRRRLSRRRR